MRFLDSILAAGREMLERRWPEQTGPQALGERCKALLTHRGDASGLALAQEIMSAYASLSREDRNDFFGFLSEEFAIQPAAILDAADTYRRELSYDALSQLRGALESPLRTLFGRINMVPGGTRAMVKMREDLLEILGQRPDLRPLDDDLRQLLGTWFNRGFLMLARIDWGSPARVLERIIEYEAVHEINGWDDLRNRLQDDRRCFAFFHLAIEDDPLIFLQVALTHGITTAIDPLLAIDRTLEDPNDTDTAVFYSISTCHKGLHGISFGHFLIKQVVEELRREFENIKQYATLSPVPGFRHWVETASEGGLPPVIAEHLESARALPSESDYGGECELLEPVSEMLTQLAAYYLLEAKRGDGQPVDSVARFHLANGASIGGINWGADGSDAGLERSFGIMVNYVYALSDIERNHEAYFQEGRVIASSGVRKLVKGL